MRSDERERIKRLIEQHLLPDTLYGVPMDWSDPTMTQAAFCLAVRCGKAIAENAENAALRKGIIKK